MGADMLGTRGCGVFTAASSGFLPAKSALRGQPFADRVIAAARYRQRAARVPSMVRKNEEDAKSEGGAKKSEDEKNCTPGGCAAQAAGRTGRRVRASVAHALRRTLSATH